MKDMEVQRNSNREQMPSVAALVDEIRAQGFGVKVIYAREGGVTVGQKPRYTETFTIPAGIGYVAPVKARK